MKLVTYPTPEAVLLRYVNCDPDFPVAELSEIQMAGCDMEGDEGDIDSGDALESIRTTGCWGFTDTRKKEIHAWVDAKCPPETLISFLAHEIGHNTGTPDPDDLQEELRANTFGDVAAEAYSMMAKARGVTE
jgi:hypothetical protein